MPKQKVKSTKSSINAYRYTARSIKAEKNCSLKAAQGFTNKRGTTWIHVRGLSQLSKIESLAKDFSVHPLVIEDITDISQRPKIEEYGDMLFVVMRIVTFDSVKKRIGLEQVSLLLTKSHVLSFEEGSHALFTNIVNRLEKDDGVVRKHKADFLFYSILDAIIDDYYEMVELVEDEIDRLELALSSDPDDASLDEIHQLRSQLLLMRKSVVPVRDIMHRLQDTSSNYFSETTRLYLRDAYDHSIQVIETIETFRDALSGILDIYFASVSNRMNEVMKVLTLLATVFIPLTFITSFYGMNFKNLPGVRHPYGPFMMTMLMIVIVLIMVTFFRKKKWL